MRRDFVLVLLIACAALGIRTYPAWQTVFSPGGVRFLETDAWYHVRLTENQVRNYPWRVTLDPFAAPDGQFVPIAPLFDTITATVVMIVHGRDAESGDVERVAALMPPLIGAFTVIAIWALARQCFDRRAALIAAALLTVLPGHFMDRTMLGFVDHHALEALLAMTVLLGFTRASASPIGDALFAGLALGCYLLAWGSGAFLVAILGVWVCLTVVLVRDSADFIRPAALSAAAALVALAVVLAFQDPGMHRYGSQVLGLGGLAGLSLVVHLVAARVVPEQHRTHARWYVLAALAALAAVAIAAIAALQRDLMTQVLFDVRRLAPDASRMGVLEARPLFLYGGQWDWAQPWTFFRSGFYVGVVALVAFAARVYRQRAASDLLLWLFALSTFVATIGQNRFGYYLVTACALLGGWLAVVVFDWAGVPHAGNRHPVARTRMPFARDAAIIAVTGVMFAPNIAPRVLLADRTASYPDYWRDAMLWLRDNSPLPFPAADGTDYYYARYPKSGARRADYSVMSWWDQGYWLTQQARRVPVANPTQERAAVAGRFYSATDEAPALAIAQRERSRYVISDYELPFRRLADGTIMGRFQTIVDWTGAAHDPFYEVVYRREGGQWTPVWMFHEPYYRSMAFRLSVLGGTANTDRPPATVATLATRVDSNGFRFRELVSEATFPDHAAARAALERMSDDAVIVGFDPWRSPFPIEALRSFVEVHASRTPDQQPGQTPWVRVFEVREPAQTN